MTGRESVQPRLLAAAEKGETWLKKGRRLKNRRRLKKGRWLKKGRHGLKRGDVA